MKDDKDFFIQLLLKENIITKESVNKAVARQWEKGGSLEENLIALGYLTKKEVIKIFTTNFGFRFIDLDNTEIDTDCMKIVPSHLAKQYTLVPVRKTENAMTVAMVNPLDENAIKTLKEKTFLDIYPLVAERKTIENVISTCYREKGSAKLEISDFVPAISTQKIPKAKRYTFDNFVTGKSNDFAYSVALSVARGYSETSNPLFVHSDVGLGKTHLLVAIWNYTIEKDQSRSVLYCSSEKFLSELDTAIEEKKMDEFRNKYNVDILLIDDIAFLGKSEIAQEQFFHIFNELYQNDKQIVVTSDRPPRELSHLAKRLISRFEGGVITGIEPPDLETRISILKKKAEDTNVPPQIISLLAERINTNIRDLEGALKEVITYQKFKKENPTIKDVEELLLRRITLKPFTD